MKSHPFARSLIGLGVAALLACPPQRADEMADEERKTPPPEPDLIYPPERSPNLPGETNRQLAARLKAEATTENAVGTSAASAPNHPTKA